ncbi:S1C family serine protease [Rivibacter subsaxonicus]|uniref:S1C family serine protease n=1 Tax=Rivibacter subsaxonicus TaxID=457575 RepID=UPI00102AE874|nr:trypsin-like peptidase domain-containing protein [Rivibacter subsaxonicus]
MAAWRLAALAWLLLAGAASLAGAAEPASPPTRASLMPISFAPALQRGLALAVGVYGVARPDPAAASTRRAGEEAGARAGDSIGAGFIVGADGMIVTAAHVVADAAQIVVRLPDQRIVAATLVGADAASDIALLKVPLRLPEPATRGESGTLRPGDWVLAVGDPYGLARSVTAGIVGGTDRHFAEDAGLLFIQTDLAMAPGSSGGPLLDINGRVVGMNTRMLVGAYGSVGMGLSVPIEIVMQIAEELRLGRPPSRPRLGASFDDVSPPAALAAGRLHALGVVIDEVEPDGVAARAGLLAGDVVINMNGSAIDRSADLARALLAWRRVEGSSFTVLRAGRLVELRP